jgi:hypothetical protein
MLRRLYFLFPDEPHAQRVVDELLSLGIPERRIHAIAEGVELKTLPPATQRQKNDIAFRIESFLWSTNLVIFAIALLVLVYALVTGDFFWGISSLAIMIISFIAGEQFAVHVPDVHLTEFTHALSHGEILLMIDVSASRVPKIEKHIHQKYPDAYGGGVSWTVDALGL